MGYKVDLSEVIEFSNKMYLETIQLIESIENIKSKINQIYQMDTFRGKTAGSIKTYLSEFHLKTLDSFQELLAALQLNMDEHIQAFQSDVDSSEYAIIKSNYLAVQEEKVDKDYGQLKETSSKVDSIIDSVSDISSSTSPSFQSVTNVHKEIIDGIHELEEDLIRFNQSKKRDTLVRDTINNIESLIHKMNGKTSDERFTVEKSFIQEHTLAIATGLNTLAQTRTFDSSMKMSHADRKGIIDTPEHPDYRKGKDSYRVTANRTALQELGVQPDYRAERDFNHRLPKNGKKWTDADFERAFNNETILKAADRRGLFTSQWTGTGKRVLNMHPEMQYLNKNVTVKHVTVSTVKGSAKGVVDSFVEPFKLDYSGLKGISKSLGVASAGLSYYSNYNDAKADGLTGKQAAARATQDTVVDVAVGSAVQAGLTAAGTALIPIPGVGTAVGALAGIAANWFLNRKGKTKNGEEKPSIMDRIKGFFH